jgi:hypothetical protein
VANNATQNEKLTRVDTPRIFLSPPAILTKDNSRLRVRSSESLHASILRIRSRCQTVSGSAAIGFFPRTIGERQAQRLCKLGRKDRLGRQTGNTAARPQRVNGTLQPSCLPLLVYPDKQALERSI